MSVLSGKSALVTAGAAGIGAAIASTYGAAGASVHIVDIDEGALARARAEHPDFLATAADVSNEADVEQAHSVHVAQFGPVDILVNCAGIAGPTACVEDIQVEDWKRCMGVNMEATFLMSRKVLPAMKQARSGRIINISSTAGWHGYPMRSPYAAAKWAIIGFTKSLAMETGQYGMTVNAICAGSIEGERIDRVIAAEAALDAQIGQSSDLPDHIRRVVEGDDVGVVQSRADKSAGKEGFAGSNRPAEQQCITGLRLCCQSGREGRRLCFVPQADWSGQRAHAPTLLDGAGPASLKRSAAAGLSCNNSHVDGGRGDRKPRPAGMLRKGRVKQETSQHRTAGQRNKPTGHKPSVAATHLARQWFLVRHCARQRPDLAPDIAWRGGVAPKRDLIR